MVLTQLDLSPCTKLKSKWIKDLNISMTTLKLIEEKVENSLQHLSTGDHFISITQVTQAMRATKQARIPKSQSMQTK